MISFPTSRRAAAWAEGQSPRCPACGVLLIFILQNTEDVRFHFLVWSFTWPHVALHDRRGSVRGAGLVRARGPPAAPAPQEPPRRTSRLTHMIDEYARHNGHADLIREAIDGQVGE